MRSKAREPRALTSERLSPLVSSDLRGQGVTIQRQGNQRLPAVVADRNGPSCIQNAQGPRNRWKTLASRRPSREVSDVGRPGRTTQTEVTTRTLGFLSGLAVRTKQRRLLKLLQFPTVPFIYWEDVRQLTPRQKYGDKARHNKISVVRVWDVCSCAAATFETRFERQVRSRPRSAMGADGWMFIALQVSELYQSIGTQTGWMFCAALYSTVLVLVLAPSDEAGRAASEQHQSY